MWDRFDDEDEWGEDEGDAQNPNHSTRPIKKKANDIVRLTYALVGNLDEAHVKLYGEAMIRDAKWIRERFDQAELEDNYILKMENAVLLKVHARALCEMSTQLTGQGSFAKEHEKLLHDAILELKRMFVDWVQTFSTDQRTDDGWGLFMD